jgi:PAS domain S-box-containing protein
MCIAHDQSSPDQGSPEQQAALSEARLNEAQRIAKIGNWEWDIVTNQEWWSPELYRILDVDPKARKASIELFLKITHPQDRERLKESAERALAHGGHHAIDVRVVMRDGTHKIVHSQGEVTFDAEGRPVRMSGTLQDITDRKAIETALRLTETRYKEAQRLAKIGNWEWNLVSNESWWSEELYRILEEDPEEYEASFESFIEKVHPDDRPMLVEGTSRVPTEGDAYGPTTIRIVFPDGRMKIVEQRIQVRPTAVIGTIWDVTERYELEEQLRESQERYSNTVELAAVGIAHVEAGGRFIWINRHFCQMLGYSKDELLAFTTKDLSHPEDVSLTDEDRAKLHAGLIDSLTWEKRYIRKDGETIWVRITSTLKRGPEGAPLYDISIVEDISDRKIARRDDGAAESGDLRRVAESRHRDGAPPRRAMRRPLHRPRPLQGHQRFPRARGGRPTAQGDVLALEPLHAQVGHGGAARRGRVRRLARGFE